MLASGLPQMQNVTGYCHCSCLPSRTLLYIPIAEDTRYLNQGTYRYQANTHIKTTCLFASFHSAGRFYSCYWNIKVVINLNPLWTLWAAIMIVLAGHAYWCKSGRDIMGDVMFSSISFSFFLNWLWPSKILVWNFHHFSVECLLDFGVKAILAIQK